MHYTEDDLILLYYREHRRSERVQRHLEACDRCAAAYREIAATLDLVAPPDVPERGDQYGLEVWQRIRLDLPEVEPAWWQGWIRWQRTALAGGVAALVVAAFVVGRTWPQGRTPAAVVQTAETHDSTERVRLAAVGDHLEQSERVLLDLLNAQVLGQRPVDVTSEQAWAADLIASNRLYREASVQAGEEEVAAVLDELERNLLDIVHGPATLTPAQLDEIRVRLDAAALLFRVRVMSDELRERELAPLTLRKTT